MHGFQELVIVVAKSELGNSTIHPPFLFCLPVGRGELEVPLGAGQTSWGGGWQLLLLLLLLRLWWLLLLLVLMVMVVLEHSLSAG